MASFPASSSGLTAIGWNSIVERARFAVTRSMMELVRAMVAPPAWRDLTVRIVMATGFFLAAGLLIGHLPRTVSDTAEQMDLHASPSSASEKVPLFLTLPDPVSLRPLSREKAEAANAAVAFHPSPDVAPPWPAAALTGIAHDRAVDCLAAAAWYEAGDAPDGERAVAQVVLNRARHPAFPASVCGVIFQGSERKTGCQFTFTCDGSLSARRPSASAWVRARAIAQAALTGAVARDVGLATHYHADYVVPYWRDGLVKLAQVGAHLFYRWPGFWGSRSALKANRTPADEPTQPTLAMLSPVHTLRLEYDQTALTFSPAADEEAARRMSSTVTNPTAAARQLDTRYASVREQQVGSTASTVSGTEHIDMPLDLASYAGSYAVRAFGLCKGKARCVVFGRITGAELNHTDGANRLGFLYVHDSRTGAEGVWWNCARTPRPDHRQCLPEGASAARLLADWL